MGCGGIELLATISHIAFSSTFFFADYEDNLPELNYRGFVGLQPDPNDISGLSLQPRDPQPYYFPARYVSPFSGANLGALDVDLVTSPSEWNAIKSALSRRKPSLTGPLRLLAATDMNPGYNVAMMHPGFPLLNSADSEALAVSMMVISVTALLDRAITAQEDRLVIYLFDATGKTTEESADFPLFLGVALSDPSVNTKFTAETDLSVLRLDGRSIEERVITIADRKWIVVVVPTDSTYTQEILFVPLGSAVILAAFVCIAVWFYSHIAKATKMAELIVIAKAETAALIVENAEQAAIVERELNDFIAHEVRNPLTAAISACSFVDTEVNMFSPLADEESRKTVREDIGIISNSLQFIDDLLRNMLDMHRATSNQMHIEMAPTDLLRDVLEPAATMLHRRGDAFEVIVDCEKNLIVQTDRMRLKQIILNLASNSKKFVQKGFIRLSAGEIDGTVKLHVDDSGPGIPMEKRKNLFVKFQESLDSLNQGTGIGLSLSKNLAVLMNGDIWLDEDFESGVEGFRGTRFVIDLNTAPLNFDSNALDAYELSNAHEDGYAAPAQDGVADSAPDRRELPDKLSVLFVDDDFVLRKLFARSIRKLAPEWTLAEAANGETALRQAASQEFDLIFMDQYMPSVQKQMLGSDATRALRAKGVSSIICGLSANDTLDTFIKAGADDFIMKPFPCETGALTRMLLRLLDSRTNPLAERTLESLPQELTPTPILE
jgi:signal transduction histidine kinase/FixJ family two-component response regulator